MVYRLVREQTRDHSCCTTRLYDTFFHVINMYHNISQGTLQYLHGTQYDT